MQIRTSSVRVGFITVAAVLSLVACEPVKPDRLQMMPTGPFKFEKKGQTEEVKISAWVGPKPFTQKVTPVYASSDTTVATVDDKGVITAAGSGTATITATAEGLSTTGEVHASMVGGLEVVQDAPKEMRLNHKGHQLTFTVKDDKGTVIKDPKVNFRATDYCVEVDDNGYVKPLADGECDVSVSISTFSQRVKFNVRG